MAEGSWPATLLRAQGGQDVQLCHGSLIASSYTKSNSPWIPTDAITALVVKELDYLDQSGARVATDWVAAVGARTYAGNTAGVGLWHVNYANGVDYQDQTSMPDDTGLGINQPISVEAALALDPNGFLKYRSWWVLGLSVRVAISLSLF